ncbi:efflux RND transporter permease subunit [Coprobacter tertius]|uniref:Efflux RND transporter permease subunit n=1 Tax=Coprobacter tertius TaxID=2944915 RepID=A0ABT1MHE8_9BACT|nr:efflux RND transporter permease subunit [Coprobacter tertius]MCP9611806.1 efflux RND transporter permease subunit [Coprobacter tertius]
MKYPFKISSFSVILAFVCLTLVGVAFIPKLAIKLSPSQSYPQLSIGFSMYGSSSRIVEKEATSKLEAMMARMRGIQGISSVSGNGWGNITIRFDEHTDMDVARFEASTIIRQSWGQLPANVSYPQISLSRSDENANLPFISYTINAPVNSFLIQQYTEKNIKTKLAQLEGVYRVDVSGATPMEWRLEYDYKQLETLGLTVSDIQTAVSNYMKKEFLGTVSFSDVGSKDHWIRLALAADNDEMKIEDVQNILIANRAGKLIKLGELVEVNHVEVQPHSYYRINGLNSIYLSVVADENANQLELGKKVKELIVSIQSELPSGYEIHLSYDATDYLKDELNKIYFRTGLTLLILLIFTLLAYRNLKYTLLISVSLFINLSIAFIFYYLLGFEIQLYSLAGITISLTLMIDNTIVMSDQIIRRGNMKAFVAIFTATLTTIASLSIIFFLDEKLKLNLIDFAGVIIVNLIISILIALFLVPAILDKLPIGVTSKNRCKYRRFGTFLLKYRLAFNRFYELFCCFIWKWRGIVVVLIILAFGLPVFLLPDRIYTEKEKNHWVEFYNITLGNQKYIEKIKPVVDKVLGGTLRLFMQNVYNGSYFSDRKETSLYITATLPNGATIDQMNTIIRRMENYISQYPEIKQFQTSIDGARRANINVLFKKEYQNTGFPYRLKNEIISKSIKIGGGSWGVYGVGDGFSNDVRETSGQYGVNFYGYNYDELYLWAERFKRKLLDYRRIKDVTIDTERSYYKDDYEEYLFNLDKSRMAEEGIEPYELFNALNTAFARGTDIGHLYLESGIENIVLYPRQSYEYNIWDLYHIPLRIKDKEYKLSELATVIKEKSPQNVSKVDQQYYLYLSFDYIGSYDQANRMLEENIKEFRKQLPMGYTVSERNWSLWGEKGMGQYWLLFIIFVIIYFGTSILFNSLKQPFYILFVIPIAYIGVFLTFYLFQLNFDQGGFASFVLLSGITINANIYILDEYNNIRARYPGIIPLKAYIKAFNHKIRPICLTVISTVLGFIPFLIGTSKEAFWFPLAAGTIGGLMMGFIATVLFLPLFMGVARKNTKGKS